MENATTFNKSIIPQANSVVKFILESPFSDFYRKKYRESNIKEIRSYDDFQRIPLLTKDEILNVKISERCFTDNKEINYYTISSGTTSNNRPAIIPVSSFNFGLTKPDISSVSKVLLLSPSLSVRSLVNLSSPENHFTVISGDINNLELSAIIAKEIEIDGINTSPTILYFFIDQLKKINFNLGQIKWIRLSGEHCPRQKLEYIRSNFSEAYIDFRYGISEVGRIGYRCNFLANDKKTNIFHLYPSSAALLSPILIEIISETGNILPLGETGELVCTHLSARPFPLIRYKTGDMASLERASCPCGNGYILTLEGRNNYDVLKFYGITLYSKLISDSLDTIKEFIEPQFQMHVFEEKIEGRLKPKLKLHIELKRKFKNLNENCNQKKIFEEKISNALRLSAKNTLKQLVDQGIFSPLQIIFVDSWPEKEAKSKNIISHLK